MKYNFPVVLALLSLGLSSCGDDNDVVSQHYIHKYGFEISEKDWAAREKEGQIVTVKRNGVTETRNYDKGLLHGKSTYTYPNSSMISKVEVYDLGVLLKEITHDEMGMPMREDAYEFDDRHIITLWDKFGTPMSIEEYDNGLLMEASYFNAQNELEAQVEQGEGCRVKRDRSGLLIEKDKIQNGVIANRTTYHSNGEVHTIANFKDYRLNGNFIKYTDTGKLLLQESWKDGTLDGIKTTYRQLDGQKIAETPFIEGKKQGVEKRYDDDGYLSAEINWENNQKHGLASFYIRDDIYQEWYFRGKKVSHEKFELLENREELFSEFPPME